MTNLLKNFLAFYSTNIYVKYCREIILFNANENWYIILYGLFSRLWYIATCGPFCKDATHMVQGNTRESMIMVKV